VTRITGILHEDQYTIMISLSVLLRMKNISENNCRANRQTHFMLSKFFQKYFCLWDTWKHSTARQIIYDHITRRLLFASWITKATNKQLEYEILIAYPLQQW